MPRFEDFINIKPRGGEERFFDPPLLYRLFFSFGTDRAIGHLSIESSKFSRVDRIVFIHDFGQFSISSLLSYTDFFAKFSFCSGVFISARVSVHKFSSFFFFFFDFFQIYLEAMASDYKNSKRLISYIDLSIFFFSFIGWKSKQLKFLLNQLFY